MSDKAMVTSAIVHSGEEFEVSIVAVQVDGGAEGIFYTETKKKSKGSHV